MKSLNGRLAVLQLIADKGCVVEYSDTGFVKPNKFISRDIIIDFLDRGYVERKGKQAIITQKGREKLKG